MTLNIVVLHWNILDTCSLQNLVHTCNQTKVYKPFHPSPNPPQPRYPTRRISTPFETDPFSQPS